MPSALQFGTSTDYANAARQRRLGEEWLRYYTPPPAEGPEGSVRGPRFADRSLGEVASDVFGLAPVGRIGLAKPWVQELVERGTLKGNPRLPAQVTPELLRTLFGSPRRPTQTSFIDEAGQIYGGRDFRGHWGLANKLMGASDRDPIIRSNRLYEMPDFLNDYRLTRASISPGGWSNYYGFEVPLNPTEEMLKSVNRLRGINPATIDITPYSTQPSLSAWSSALPERIYSREALTTESPGSESAAQLTKRVDNAINAFEEWAKRYLPQAGGGYK